MVFAVGALSQCAILHAAQPVGLPLSRLTPEKALAPLPVEPAPAFVAPLFALRPTDEARERLRGLDRPYQEKLNYRTHTQNDVTNYQNANRELALWYVRALMRARLGVLIGDTRERLREDRRRDEIKERAIRASGGWVDEPTRPGVSPLSRSPDGHVREISISRASPLLAFLFRAGRVVEDLTNAGLPFRVSGFSGNLRLDPQSTEARVRFFSPVLDAGVSYRLRPSEKPLPFSGNGSPGAERFSVSGAHTLALLDLSGAVTYMHLHRSLGCSLGRRILGPLLAHVEKTWTFAGNAGQPGLVSTSGGVNLSVSF